MVVLDSLRPIIYCEPELEDGDGWPPKTERETQNYVCPPKGQARPKSLLLMDEPAATEHLYARMASTHYAVPRYYCNEYRQHQPPAPGQSYCVPSSSAKGRKRGGRRATTDSELAPDNSLDVDVLYQEPDQDAKARWRKEMSQPDAWRSAKMNRAAEIVKKRLSEDSGKIILFELFDASQFILTRMCEAHGWEYVQYTTSAGDDNARKRADSMFKNNPSVRIMIASTKMGSQGFNWHMANTVVFLTLDHTPGVVDQCIKRAARFPNSRDVHVFTTRAQESIDTHIEQDICAPKREQNQKLLMSSKLEGFATFDEISSMDAKQIVSMLDSKEMPGRGHTTLWAPGVLQ